MFIVASITFLFFFETIWLDYLYTVNLLSLLASFLLSQSLLDKKLGEDNLRVDELLQEAKLYKNRFDTIVVEHQKKVFKSEAEIKELNDTIQLQKERLEKLDSVIKHQEIKCVEVGLYARKLSLELQDLKKNNDLFETYCSNMVEKINKKNAEKPVKKVPLVALRKQPKQSNKIALADLAKNLKR